MIKVVVAPAEGQTAEQAVDEEINRFDQFMRTHVDDQPLTRFERAILKTYWAWKVRSGTQSADAPVGSQEKADGT